MAQSTVSKRNVRECTPRARLYGMALVITLSYMLIGRLNNDNDSWVQVNLPLSSASLLLLSLSGAEAYLYVQRVQRHQAQLEKVRAREIELSQHLAFQRQSTLNHISRALIDKLDVTQISQEVLESIAELFEADAVATWISEKNGPTHFALKSAFGFTAHNFEQLEASDWSFPVYEQTQQEPHQIILDNLSQEGPPTLAAVCEREHISGAVLNPIIRRDELVGIIGIFYRKTRTLNPSLTAEMLTVANIIASAVQAEELYRDLVQVQKIESIGTLTSGIAHDFNNVLAAILACANYVKQHTDPSSPTYRYLEATEASALRGAALTKQLLAFARREGPHLIVLNANDCVEQTLKMLDRSFDKTILIQRQFAKDLHSIEADPSQLEQVILNIAVNARDAMPEGGMFTITTHNVHLEATDPFRPAVSLPDGDYVVLGFRDTGCGMDEATLARIFEPFFTTKRPGNGTGLGLSLVLSIIKGFEGEIRVESKPGQGALFEIFLPASEKVATTTPAPTVPIARGGHECILLAEDEDVIREMAQIGLESKGYRVFGATDGAMAASIYREHWREIDLVVADMVMPRMSGPELFGCLKEVNPGVRVVVSSGYSHDQEGQRMLRHGCLGYLQKPYNIETLNQLVRSVLDSGL
ncbi:MAG TPA: ATP-binding protein [Verrucomicrobiae bacterium]|nr:ATP-binding protein [Verrucomicrobiae bacterium]